MYKILEKKENTVLVEMDIQTFEWIERERNEDFKKYEFVFDEPIKASKLVNI